MTTASARNTTDWTTARLITSSPWSRTAYIIAMPKQMPERDAEHRPQHGHHHRLEGHHQPQLTSAEADRPQQTDLPGALDDRQRQRVHDPEDRDHQRQPEQRVDHQHQLVDRRPLLVGELLLVLDGDHRQVRRPSAGAGRSSSPACGAVNTIRKLSLSAKPARTRLRVEVTKSKTSGVSS